MSEETKIYKEVASSLEKAIRKADGVKLVSDEEKSELQAIRNTLEQLNKEFQEDIDKLEHSSEWDRFCMAFFGETNAGKSTVIEALRIIYDEESRLSEIEKQKKSFDRESDNNLEKYKELLNSLEELQESIATSYSPPPKVKKEKVIIYIIIGLVVGILVGFILGTGFGNSLLNFMF